MVDFPVQWRPCKNVKLTPQLILTRWLVILWETGHAEGNRLLDEALPGSPELDLKSNWPQATDVDDILRFLITAGWIERGMWCPDLTMARYVYPGRPTKDTREICAAGYAYRPHHTCRDYEEFVTEWKFLLQTLPHGKFVPGDVVKFTPTFLHSTHCAQERMVVKLCTCRLCEKGNFVAIDQRGDTAENLADYANDLEYCDHLRQHPWRHVAVGNLKRV